MIAHRTLFPAAALAALVAAAEPQAQLPAPDALSAPSAAEPIRLIRSAHGIVDRPDAIVGMGHRYEARFEPGRIELLPALGERAPRNLPLSFCLESVSRGGVVVHRADPGVAPTRAGDRVSYARGPAIEERYDVGAAGVLQSFLFESLPPGSGDLVVRCRLETELAPRPDGEGGLCFDAFDLGGIHYGAVTGIDADGDAVAGSLRLDGGALELVLPGSFVDAASFPLLLDPLIGAVIAVDDSAEVDVFPDAASEAPVSLGFQRCLVVWHRAFSLTNANVYGQLVDTGGELVGGLISISGGTPSSLARDPAAGFVEAEGAWLVAYTYLAGAGFEPQITCNTVSIGGTVSAPVLVSPSLLEQSRPDVGGDWSGSDDEAFVVWEEEGVGIRGRTVTATHPSGGNPIPNGSAFTIGSSGTPVTPRISGAVDRGVDFLVVWDTEVTGPRHYVYGRMYDRNGNSQTPATPLYDSPFYDHRNPDCDGDGDAFLVAWQRSEAPLSAAPYDVVVRAVTWDGSDLILDQPVRPIEEGSNDDETAPSVAMTDSNAIVSFLEEDPSGTNVYVKNVDPFTGYRRGELRIANGVDANQASVVAAGRDDVLVVWDDANSFDVFGQVYDGVGTSNRLSGGCGVEGRTVIPLAIADNDEFRIHLRSATPNVLAACVTGLSTDPIGCGVCTLLPTVEVVYYDTTDANGHASVNIPLPASYAGVTFYSQWVTFVPIGVCPLAPIDFSDPYVTTISSNP